MESLLREVITYLPGIIAGLTNTDVGAVATYSESGATYGLAAVKFQVLCVPAMYAFQELGARIGAQEGRGFAGLVEERFGRRAAYGLFVAMVWMASYTVFCQFTGIAAIAAIASIPAAAATACFGLALLWVLFVSTAAEYVALGLSALLGAFVILAVAAIADGGGDADGSASAAGPSTRNAWSLDLGDKGFDLLVVSATIGGSITPWLAMYQCAATIRTKIAPETLWRTRPGPREGASVYINLNM